MKSQRDFVISVVDLLDEQRVEYMLTGSIAASFYGRPRATNDADLVIACHAAQLPALLDAIRDRGWYASETAAREAIERRLMFNVIDPISGWKADLIVKKSRPFSDREFARRVEVSVFGDASPALFMATPEDVILSKLEWCRSAGSDRQFDDALAIASARWPTLDRAYLETWAQDLGVTQLYRQLCKGAAP